MKTWTVVGHVTISITTEVKARTAKEAMRIAAKRSIASVHIPDPGAIGEQWLSGEEMDGDPIVVEAEEES